MKVAEIAGTRAVIPERPSFLITGLDYGRYSFDTMMHAWDGASFRAPDAVRCALFNTLTIGEDGRVRSGDFTDRKLDFQGNYKSNKFLSHEKYYSNFLHEISTSWLEALIISIHPGI